MTLSEDTSPQGVHRSNAAAAPSIHDVTVWQLGDHSMPNWIALVAGKEQVSSVTDTRRGCDNAPHIDLERAADVKPTL